MPRPRAVTSLLSGLIFGCLSALAASFAPEEQVWCELCRSYVDAPHSEAHSDKPGFGYCDECEGFFEGVENRTHIHVGTAPSELLMCHICGKRVEKDHVHPAFPKFGYCEKCAGFVEDAQPDGHIHVNSDVRCDVCGVSVKYGEHLSAHADLPDFGYCGSCGKFAADAKSPTHRCKPPPPPPEQRWKKWAIVAAAGVFAFIVLVSLLVHARPQGITLKRDVLVCAADGMFDGGTSQVYKARFRSESGKWESAFVKRIIGKGMRGDQRFPMLRFEAGVLRRLEKTEVVPRVLVDPDTVTLADGSHWSYYAMSAAQGTPWPEHGGLGGDTHKALAALCEALMSLHGLGIGHHDLKPENIFWDSRRKRVTLLDFGSAIDHKGEFVNPIGGTMTGTKPWIPPVSDGTKLNDLTVLSDNWVYGLLFCQAILGCIKNDDDRTQRHTPEKSEDREWLRENLARETSPTIADAVVDGLFAIDKTHRMKLQEFLELLRREWEV